jgi:hypothetical protein
MHVWQYQNRGTGYISNSIWHQATEPAAYEVTIVPNQSIYRYTAEHQAVIVEAYYVDLQAVPTAPATQFKYDPSTTVNPPFRLEPAPRCNPDTARDPFRPADDRGGSIQRTARAAAEPVQ